MRRPGFFCLFACLSAHSTLFLSGCLDPLLLPTPLCHSVSLCLSVCLSIWLAVVLSLCLVVFVCLSRSFSLSLYFHQALCTCISSSLLLIKEMIYTSGLGKPALLCIHLVNRLRALISLQHQERWGVIKFYTCFL